MGSIRTSPRTPRTNTPNPPRPGRSVSCDDATDDYAPQPSAQEAEVVREPSHPSSAHFCDDVETQTCLAGESQAVDGNGVDDSLCNEIFDSYVILDDSGLNGVAFDGFARFTNDIPGVDNSVICGIVDLENLELDTPPDFQLATVYRATSDGTKVSPPEGLARMQFKVTRAVDLRGI
ncbi:hypothetical protein Acr_00g0040350 [Actinidia rufa]|uniref:Uncharacterized protein n=1 Tax=Actinidia rufa TaxID=165716 RepID=A0A7J0DJI6_9ERIC|nr:hypothetical protein Acr_00g0040350 [Actinidia rufa]